MKLSKVFKYASLTAAGLLVVHVLARIVAGVTIMNNPRGGFIETDTEIFWEGFWTFDFLGEGWRGGHEPLRLLDVLGPHFVVLGAIGLVAAIIVAARWYAKASEKAKIIAFTTTTAVVSVSAIIISIMNLAMQENYYGY